MKKPFRLRQFLRLLNHYAVFFLIIAFVISCCTMLFVQLMSETMGLTLTEEHIRTAAKWTFVNVLLLSLLYTVIDAIRRKLTVERPVKRIIAAAQKMAGGDFRVRIPPVGGAALEDGFDQIIACFNTMAEELSGIETLRTDFIANVSHELKTPLAVIQNYGTLLQQPQLSEQERLEYAKAITGASRRLTDLISNILKLNKLENQQIFPERQTYDLGEQLCACLLNFEELWETKALEIDTAIEEDVLVESDPEMMSLVWNNLFSNAIKFTEPGGRVSLRLTTDGGFAVVQIADTGCGISQEVGAHIFDKFYQGDTSHATQGNGLGLALVKRVIDITQSDISVESTVGKGSTFTVRMERVRREEAPEAAV